MNKQVFIGSVDKYEEVSFLTEAAMQEQLRSNKDILSMGQDGVRVIGFEVPWRKSDKKNGRIDLLIDYELFVAVVELKNDKLTLDHLAQLMSYLDGSSVKESVPLYYDAELSQRKGLESETRGILVGFSWDFDLLAQIRGDSKLKSRVALVSYNRFKDSNDQYFHVVDLVHPFDFTKRDYSKYTLEGDSTPYVKNWVVYACVKRFLADNNSVSFKNLKDKIKDEEDTYTKRVPILLEAGNLDDHKYKDRYLINKPLKCGEVTFVVQGYWTIGDEELYKNIAINLGYPLTKLN